MKRRTNKQARKPAPQHTSSEGHKSAVAQIVSGRPSVPRADNHKTSGTAEFFRISWDRGWLPFLILVIGIFVAYQPAWRAGFMWDDDDHLTANPCIVGTAGFEGIWTSGAATYYPLVLTTFWVQHAIWGLNPVPYHLFNIAMHAACAVILWRVLRCMNIPGAWLGAALWAFHPVQVESVAWITELKNTQSCVFYLLTILFFLKWRSFGSFAGRKGTEWDYALVLFVGLLAILSKASTVILPAVLALLWWWMEKQWRWRNLIRLAPLFLISGAASAWTIWEQQFHSRALGSEWDQSWLERFITAGKIAWFYLGKLFWPHPLTFIYPRWEIRASEATAYLPLFALVAGLSTLWFYRWRRFGFLFFAFAYFLICLFPVLDFFKVYFFRYSFVGDHFQYLAGIGPLAVAAAGIIWMFKGRIQSQALQIAGCGALLLFLSGLTWREAREYQNNETLWRATLADNPKTWLAQNNFGYILIKQRKLDEAIAHYHEALKIRPNYADAYNNLGIALQNMGQIDGAITNYLKALEMQSEFPVAENNLANAYFQQGRIDQAITHYQRAVELAPG